MSTQFTIHCPNCDAVLLADTNTVGRKVRCTSCHHRFKFRPLSTRETRESRNPTPTAIGPPTVHPPNLPSAAISPREILVETSPSNPVIHTTRPRPYRIEIANLRKNSLAVTSLVMGIVALCFFWLPIVGLCLAVIGTLFGLSAILVALARRGAGLGFAIGGTTLAIVALFPSGKVTSVAVDVAAWLDDFQKDRGFTNDADEQRRAVELYRGFHVQKFRLTGSGELSDPTVVHALLINNTRFAISSVKLRVIHKHDQRQTPYFDEVLHLEIDGGIEPGESYEGAWEPNLFLSSIADEFQRKEAGFQIYKLCLYGPDEKALAADLEGVPIKSN